MSSLENVRLHMKQPGPFSLDSLGVRTMLQVTVKKTREVSVHWADEFIGECKTVYETTGTLLTGQSQGEDDASGDWIENKGSQCDPSALGSRCMTHIPVFSSSLSPARENQCSSTHG